MRRGNQMLALRPTLLSRKPLQQLTDEAQEVGDLVNFAEKACFVIGGGLLVGAAVAAVVDSQKGDRRR